MERRPIAERTHELIRAVAALNEEIAVWVRTEEQNKKLLHDLGERVKELTALHGVAQMMGDRTRSVPSLMEEVVSALPPAWQYPEITSARIRFDGVDYTSEEFATSSWKQSCEVTLADGRPLVMEIFYLTEKPAEWEGPFLAEERRLINSLVQIVKSSLDRRQAEEALRESEGRIRDLAGRLIVAQEEERMRIARDLHDDVLQQIADLAIEISHLKTQIDPSSSAARSCRALESKAERVSMVVRQISHDLHPATLTYTDLFSALRSFLEEFERSTGIRADLRVEGSPRRASAQLSLSLFRITQEALRNVAKHSGAKEAVVSIAIGPEECHLRISDRGRGFIVQEGLLGGGLGLRSMEERAHLLRGTVSIESEPGKGTTIQARAPLVTVQEEGGRSQAAP